MVSFRHDIFAAYRYNPEYLENNVVGSANEVRTLQIFTNLLSGTQSNDLRSLHLQVMTSGSSITSQAGGNGIRTLHAAAVHDSTGTCAELNAAQFNSIIGVQGSAVNAGTTAIANCIRVLCGFSTSGTGAITTGRGILIQSPNNTSVSRTIGEYTALEIQDCEKTGVSKAMAIVTGTGSVEFGGILKTNAGRVQKITSTGSGNYTVLETDFIIHKTAIGAGDTVTLPEAPETGQVFIIKDANGGAGANNLIIDTTGAPTIDGAGSVTLTTNYSFLMVYFDGTNYSIWGQ